MMKVEIRADSVTIEGYVNAVGRDSRVMQSPTGQFVEQVEPKTFERALSRTQDVDLMHNHKRTIGGVVQGNLALQEDAIGLHARATVTDTAVIEAAKNGELRGWSFGFSNPKDRIEPLGDGLQRRYLEDLELQEVSIIDSSMVPAYVGTSIEMRSGSEMTVEYRGFGDNVETYNLTPKSDANKPDYSVQRAEIELMKLKGR